MRRMSWGEYFADWAFLFYNNLLFFISRVCSKTMDSSFNLDPSLFKKAAFRAFDRPFVAKV
jgi:hypothetical protein